VIMAWEVIWKIVLVSSLTLFAALTVVTTIFGAADVRRLFQRLEDERQGELDSSRHGDEAK